MFTIPNEADAAHANQAEIDKVDIDILTAALAGTGVETGCAVTAQVSPDMTVAVAAGSVRINDMKANVAAGNVTVGAAHSTNPRFDLITVNNTGAKACTAGVAAVEPVFPAIPANSVVLAAVYVFAADTTINSNQIVDKRVALNVALNPATRFLLTTQTSPDGNVEIYRTDLTTKLFTRVTGDTSFHSWWPKPSPDGSRILFCRTSVADATAADYDQDYSEVSIWVMNADGTGATEIVPVDTLGAGAVQGTPNWHPNGRDIVFFGGVANALIRTVQVDGSNLTSVAVTSITTGISDTIWSPDGTRIAFCYLGNVYTVAAAGGAATQITTDGGTTPNYDPAYSPDNLTIAYLTRFATASGPAPAGEWGIRTMAATGVGSPTTIINDGHISSKPSWADDGFLYFHRLVYGTDSNFQLAKIQADGSGSVIRLTPAGSSMRAYPEVWWDRAAVYAASVYAAAYAQVLAAIHPADTSAAHAASSLGYTPVGSISSNNLQDAVAEVAFNAAVDLANHIASIRTVQPGLGVSPNTSIPGQISFDATAPDVQEFGPTPGAATWTKPSWAHANSIVDIVIVAEGGPGGSGARGAAGTVRGGGGGGAAGNYARLSLLAGELGATETVTIGAHGTVGASVTTNDTAGNPGVAAVNTSFGVHVVCSAGGPGLGGTVGAHGAGGDPGPRGQFAGQPGANGAGAADAEDLATSVGTITATNPVAGGSGGGGGGGGRDAGNTNRASSAGGTTRGWGRQVVGGAGGAGGFGGAPGTPAGPFQGSGGGGGAFSNTGVGQPGGAGAFPGAGGGGGGSCTNSGNTGAGALGGGAYVRVITRR